MRSRRVEKNELKNYDDEQIIFYCPVRNCDYKSVMLSRVKIHFKKAHAELLRFCPVCKRKVKVVKHCLDHIDEKHLVLYYLTRSSNQKTNNLYSIAEKVAYLMLQKKNFKF